jgi:hypothetical protein
MCFIRWCDRIYVTMQQHFVAFHMQQCCVIRILPILWRNTKHYHHHHHRYYFFSCPFGQTEKFEGKLKFLEGSVTVMNLKQACGLTVFLNHTFHFYCGRDVRSIQTQYYIINYIRNEARCWWRSWVRPYATSRKVVCSIPDGFLWNFSLTYSFWPHSGPGVDIASNRNEYQEYFLGVKAAGA